MLFNSSDFLVLFFFTFVIYWFLPPRPQNAFMLLMSYVFFGWFDWRFLFLLIATTILDFACGLGIEAGGTPRVRQSYLLISWVGNLAILGFFKYCDFFIDSVNQAARLAGLGGDIPLLRFAVPVGISFYAFQSMSYTMDVYRGKCPATRSLVDYALFTAFFPSLVAGPIERAGELLPQIAAKRVARHKDLMEGALLAGVGFFKKVVIADNIAVIIDPVFGDIARASSGEIALAGLLFAFQIYYDFAGYSEIAYGVSQMMGFSVDQNFRRPYLAKNPAEFWTRWHITLSTWFQEYVFTPLALASLRKRSNFFTRYRAHFWTMVLVGLWHGAHARFLVFGLFWAGVLILYNARKSQFDQLPAAARGLITFGAAMFGWFLFRIDHAGQLALVFTNLSYPSRLINWNAQLGFVSGLIALAMIFEWMKEHGRTPNFRLRAPELALQWGHLALLIACGFWLKPPGQLQFLYFQF